MPVQIGVRIGVDQLDRGARVVNPADAIGESAKIVQAGDFRLADVLPRSLAPIEHEWNGLFPVNRVADDLPERGEVVRLFALERPRVERLENSFDQLLFARLFIPPVDHLSLLRRLSAFDDS